MRSDDPKLDCRFGYDDERTEHSEAGSAHLWAVQVADTHANLRPTHIHITHTNGIRYKHTRSSYSVMSEDLLRSIWYIYEQYMRKWPPSSTSKQPVWKPPKNKFIIYYVSCSGCAVLCRGTVYGTSANIYTYIYTLSEESRRCAKSVSQTRILGTVDDDLCEMRATQQTFRNCSI